MIFLGTHNTRKHERKRGTMNHFSNSVRALKAQFSQFVEEVTQGFSIPEKKLVADLLWGLLGGGSVFVSDIARGLHEENTLDSTEVRLTKAIQTFDYAKLDDAIAERVFSVFAKPYSLFIDESDIGKEQARKLESLCRVRDGSKSGDVFHTGYHMTGLGAVGGSRRNVMVLKLDIWSSTAKGFVSSNEHTQGIIKNIRYIMNDSACEMSLDRGYDDAETMNFLDKYEIFYCIRAKSSRKYDNNGNKYTIDELAGKLKGKYVQSFIDSEGNCKEVKCSGTVVTHPDFGHEVMLAMERFSDSDVRFYLTNRVDVTKKGVMDAIRLYRKRWRIEEVFRFAKQEFRLEKFLVRSMNAMNVLSSMAALAINFLSETIIQRNSLYHACRKAYPKFLSQQKKEEEFATKDRFALELYHIEAGLRGIMAHAGKRPEIRKRIRKKQAEQCTIFNS